MKNLLLNIYRCIVGTEYGFTGEGNEQWYYTMSLVINLMLVWWLKPEVALLFTILAIIHYVTVFVYGFSGLSDKGATYAYGYLGIHVILFLIAIFASLEWAIINIAITTIAFLLAPDCTGKNIFLREPYQKISVLFNTIIFVAFVVIDFLLPINLWIKIVFIIGALIIHPVIDYIEGECGSISDVTEEVFDIIKNSMKSKTKR